MGKKVIVIGGGAGGLMAAGRAAELGAGVTLLEKTGRIGQKILISGNGRCNLSHSRDLNSFIAQYGDNGKFLYSVYSRFFREELLAFLKRYGMETVTEPEGKIYPVSQNARDVVRLLAQYLKDTGVDLHMDTGAREILVEDKKVTGVLTTGGIMPADAVILATGGASRPWTGSNGEGYKIAEAVGHRIVRLRPGLVPLVVEEAEMAKVMMGASLRDCRVTAFACRAKDIDAALVPGYDTGRGLAGKKPKPPVIESRRGDAIITHFGLSGPIVLEMSLAIVDARENGPVSVSIDLKPELTEKQLNELLQRTFERHSKATFAILLKGIVIPKMMEPLMQMAGIKLEKTGSEITAGEREKLAGLIKCFRFNIQGAFNMETAMVTAGGVSLKEIDPRTLESKLISGLYFCGEVMDLDAGTGGYNLQAAFSTGYVAGESAALG